MYFDYLPLLSLGHCVVCSSLIFVFWLPPFVIFMPLCCLFLFSLCILITPLLSLGHCVVCFSLVYDFDYLPLLSLGHCVVCSSLLYDFDYLPSLSLGHCVVCSSFVYVFWFPPFVIFRPLCCLCFFNLCILFTSLCYL
jgi:hypothetical protein